MIYTLFCIEGGTRNVLPSVNSLSALKTACTGGYGGNGSFEIADSTRNVYGKRITLSLPVGESNDFLDTGVTHVAIQTSYGAPAVMYYVTSCIPIRRETTPTTYSLRMTAELCGTFTAALAEGAAVQRWEFDRYSPKNTIVDRTSEPIDGAFQLQQTLVADVNYDFPGDYCIVITFSENLHTERL